jgi:hypothetical protein
MTRDHILSALMLADLITFRVRLRTREPFGEDSIKILPIPTFIDDYNHYIGGIDQSNQLRAAFTTYFPRN